MTKSEEIDARLNALAETIIAIGLRQPVTEEEAAFIAGIQDCEDAPEKWNAEDMAISRRLYWEQKTGINDW